MYKNILHASDLSENHFDLCKKVVKFAHAIGAQLHFLHVIETPASLQWAQSLGFAELATPVKDGAQVVMTTLSDALNISPENMHVEIGSAYLHILESVKALGSDLVILGSHSTTSMHTFLGSTAQAVIHHAPCDVLTMRTDS